jgi:hypothetical protein
MLLFKSILFFSVLLFVSVGQAATHCCKERNDIIDSYLDAHPGWSIVETSDLPDDDKALWKNYHEGLCPGIAIVDVDGGGRKSYALALKRKVKDVVFEKLVVLKGSAGAFSEHVLVNPTRVISPFVVYRVGPGKYLDHNTGKTIRIAHDSIVYEKMEAISMQFYFSNGKPYSLLAAE